MERWNVNKLILLLGAGLVALAIVLNVSLAPSSAPEMAPFLPGILAALALVWWSRPWLYLVAGILLAAFPLVIIFVFGASGALTHPAGGMETLVILLLLGGSVFALLGGIMGFVQRKAQPPTAGGLRTWQAIATVLLVGALLGYAVANGYGTTAGMAAVERPVHYAESVDEHVRVVTTDFAFAPKAITIPAGKLVSIDIENKDSVLHTFSYHLADGAHEQVIYPSSTQSILVKFDTPQTIHVWCAPHSGGQGDTGEDSMWMDMTVS